MTELQPKVVMRWEVTRYFEREYDLDALAELTGWTEEQLADMHGKQINAVNYRYSGMDAHLVDVESGDPGDFEPVRNVTMIVLRSPDHR